MKTVDKSFAISSQRDQEFFDTTAKDRYNWFKSNLKGLKPFTQDDTEAFEESFDFLFNESVTLKDLEKLHFVKATSSSYGFFKKDYHYTMMAKYMTKEVPFDITLYNKRWESLSEDAKDFVVKLFNKIENKEVMSNMKAALVNLTKTPFSEFEVFDVFFWNYERYWYPYIYIRTKESSRYPSQYAMFFVGSDLRVRLVR